MNVEQYITFTVVVTVLLLSPGPSVLLSINNGLNYGTKLAAIGVLGNVVAFQLLLLLSATSFGALILAFSGLLSIIKITGAAYLCYLGVKVYHSPVSQINTDNSSETIYLKPLTIFKQAFLVTSLNPKALIFISALLPQFIEPTLALVPQVVAFCLISAVIHFTIYFCYAALASKAKYLLNSNKRRRRFNQFSGVVFLAFGIVLGVSGFMD